MKKLLIGAIMIGFVIPMVTFGTTEDKKSQDKNEVQINIEKLIQQWGDDDFQKRESAQKELTEYGATLIEQYRKEKSTSETQRTQRQLETLKNEIEKFAKAIQNACQNKDSEIKMRANQISQHFYTSTQPRIAFGSSQHDGKSANINAIYVMDADGKNQTRLTDNEADNSSPAWSPDGNKIAFVSARDGNQEIYVMDTDGKNQTRLTDNEADNSSPAWSPDGNKIVFVLNRGKLKYAIYVMDADGKNQTRLTDNEGFGVSPAWSPDGNKIAFSSDRNDKCEIYVMDADGKNQTRLTDNNKAWNNCPAWSPDGKKIAFVLEWDGNLEVYVIDADGKNQTRLTDNKAWNNRPAWSPLFLPEITALFTLRNERFAPLNDKDKK